MPVNIGPRIGIDGEAQYRSQINNIIQSTKTLKAEMTQTEERFKSSGSAMAKNRELAENLSKQIDAQREKVAKLKDMTAQAAAKYGEADTRTLKWKEALANANTELAAMEREMGGLSPAVKGFVDTLAETGGKLKAIGQGMQTAGKAMTTYVTAPILAVGAASVKSFGDVDKGLDTIRAKTGATGEDFDDLKSSMEQLATSMNITFEDAGKAVGEVNTRFEVTGDELTDLSSRFAMFAKLNGTDVSNSVDKVQASMAAFNMDASQAGEVLDILNKAGQNTGVSVDKLASDLTANSVALKEMGFDLNTSVGFLSSLNKNGIDSSTVMAGMRKALKNATKEGKTLDEALAELEAQLLNAENSTEAMALATELFGNTAGPQLASAISEGRLSLSEAANTVEDYGGSVEDTFTSTVDATDEFQAALNQLKLVGADLASVMMKMVTPTLQKLAAWAKQLKAGWDGLSTSQKELIIKIAAIAAAAGPVVTIIGKIVSGVGALMTAAPMIATTIGTVATMITGTLIPTITAAAVAAAPFLIGGAIVAGVVAAVVLIVKNWDKIKEAAGKLRDNVVKAVTTLKTKALNVIDGLKTGFSNKVNALKTGVVNKFDALKTAVSNKVNALKNSVVNQFDAIKTAVSNKVNTLKTSVVNKITSLKTGAESKITALKNAVSNTFDGIKTALTNKAESIRSSVSGKFESIRSAISSKINSAKDTVKSAIDKMKGFFNFSWSLPKIKLPHFKITGSFSLMPPKTPTFSVDWYRRAYDNPLMFTAPTVLATAGGYKGFGDGAGGEIVIGRERAYAWIRDAVAAGEHNNRTTTNNYGDINVVVNGAPGQDVRALADAVADRIQQKMSMRRRGGS